MEGENGGGVGLEGFSPSPSPSPPLFAPATQAKLKMVSETVFFFKKPAQCQTPFQEKPVQ